MTTKELYQAYVTDKAGVWSLASSRSEVVRLNKLLPHIDGDAPKLWAVLQDYAPIPALLS